MLAPSDSSLTDNLAAVVINDSPTIDDLEAAMLTEEKAVCPVVHRFTPGMYIREITMPAGTMLTSARHKTKHPYVVSKGTCYVTDDEGNRQVISAPHTGITEAGTRRAIYIEEEVIWTTFHATKETDLESICEELLDVPNNPLVEDKSQLCQWRDSIPALK